MENGQAVGMATAEDRRPRQSDRRHCLLVSICTCPSFPSSLDSQRGRQVMELFAQVAHDQGAGVIVVTHDHRALDVFDTIYEMEDGVIQRVKER
jgi:ABC-type polar amino acid transport system ATPase subunit